MGRRNYLGAMTQARHCVTLRWPLRQILVACYVWLDPPPAASGYVMCFRFCE